MKIKFFLSLLLIVTGSILGFAGPSKNGSDEEEFSGPSMSEELKTYHYNQALKAGYACATAPAHIQGRNCLECCKKMRVHEDYIDQCIEICKEQKRILGRPEND